MMNNRFVQDRGLRVPEVGSLIRSESSWEFINLVLKVGPPTQFGSEIHSVRYARINGFKFELLKGTRCRPFLWDSLRPGWQIVKEYGLIDNSEAIADHLKFLEGKDLYWKEDE